MSHLPLPPPPYGQLLTHTPGAAGEQAWEDRENLQKTGQGVGETTVLSRSNSLRKAKERFPAVGLVRCKIKRRPTSLRILPQEGAGSVEQEYPHKAGESHRINTWQGRPKAPPLEAAGRDWRGDCYSRGESSNTKLNGRQPRKHDITKRSQLSPSK